MLLCLRSTAKSTLLGRPGALKHTPPRRSECHACSYFHLSASCVSLCNHLEQLALKLSATYDIFVDFCRTIREIRRDMHKQREWRNELEKMKIGNVVGSLSVESKTLRASLVPITQRTLEQVMSGKSWHLHSTQLCNTCHTMLALGPVLCCIPQLAR